MTDAPKGVRIRIGADENGLGPQLGPMITTAVHARVAPDAWPICGKKPKGALAKRLGDSKAFVAHGQIELAEAWARALAERRCGREDHPIETPDELLHAIALEEKPELRELCPRHVEAQCWSLHSERFVAEPKLVKTLHRDLDRLAEKGIEVAGVRTSIACSKRLNEALDRGHHRYLVDLHAMERLVLDVHARAGEEVYAVCGKVGGFGKYEQAFGPLSGRLFSTLEETRPRSTYRFPGLGTLSFVMDADATDILVAMASMVGKYVRELLMDRIVSHYRQTDADLPQASGYHDPITKRFIEATALVRKKQRIPDTCFRRRSLNAG